MVSLKKLRWPHFLGIVGIWLFWSTAVSTSWSRIAAIQTIEPYAFAVHEQLIFNYSKYDAFFQTIHSGYDDSWTWSGHRALTLPFIAKLYGLYPSILWLSILLITIVSLGAIPAGLLGRKYLGHDRGFGWGVFVYLSCPASMALALQDYQDLVLALPCLIFSFWAFSSGKWWLVILGAVFGMAPREECVAMVLVAACLFRPKKKLLWMRNVVLVLVILFLYISWAEYYYPLAGGGHDMPLENALRTVRRGRIFLEGWLSLDDFYALVWIPIGIFALFSPVTAMAGGTLCLLHMTIPQGHGVDRSWAGHCHHMAPAVAFSVAATIVGSLRFFKWIRKFHLLPMMVGVLLLWSSWWWVSWGSYYHLIPAFYPTKPLWEHPAWTLANALPPDAVPVVARKTSIVASSFQRSYTFDESLYSKEPRKGLGKATHAIVDKRRKKVMAWLSQMEGYRILLEEYPFVLISWNRDAVDKNVRLQPRFPHVRSWTGPYSKGSDIPGVPLHESKPSAREQGGFPIIDIWRKFPPY